MVLLISKELLRKVVLEFDELRICVQCLAISRKRRDKQCCYSCEAKHLHVVALVGFLRQGQ